LHISDAMPYSCFVRLLVWEEGGEIERQRGRWCAAVSPLPALS